MKYKITILLFCLFFFDLTNIPSAAAYEEKIKYEQCDCTNNKFTKHLTEPYKNEIEQWFIQTAPWEEQLTEANAPCINCQPEPKNTGLIDSALETLSNWWKNLWKDPEEKKTSPFPSKKKKKPNFIPSVCFQMSGKMIEGSPDSPNDFFTCIRNHYDGSDSDNMCVDTVNKPGYPKKCFAIPVPCEDTNNPSLKCAIKFKDNDDRQRKNGCNKGSSFPRRPCLNEEYTAMTSKAFHDVAECLDVPLQLAFPTLHHEARFLINNESKTGALCYAQVTGDAIADFNTFLKNKPNYPEMKDLLPENIKKRCPEKWKHFKKVDTTYNKRRKRFEIKSDHDKCKLNLNPYTCFFYGLSYIKILINKVENIVEKKNRIETVKRNNRTLIFWGEDEKRKTEKKMKTKLKTEKIKIFSDEARLKEILAIIGYNGGTSVPVPVFRDFMYYLKKVLADRRNTKLRMDLLNGGLSIPFFINSFQTFLKRNYPNRKRKRRNEVANYMNKVHRDMNSLRKAIQSKYPNLFPDDICSP